MTRPGPANSPMRPLARLCIVATGAALMWGGVGAQAAQSPAPVSLTVGRVVLANPERVNEGAIDLGESTSSATQAESPGNEWLIAPLPSRNPTVGWTLGMPVCYLYRPPGAKAGSPVWTTGAAGFYAENKSWGAGAFHKMSLADDRWRIMAGAFYGDLYYSFYGIGASDSTRSLPLRQKTASVIGEVLREVSGHFYAGLRVMNLGTTVRAVQLPPGLPPALAPTDLGRKMTLLAFSPRAVYDTRDSEFYPTRGTLLDAQLDVSAKAAGSDLDYERYSFSWNHYQEAGSAGVVALRMAMKYTAGDAPFFLYPTMGQSSDLRGYTAGAYRDRILAAAQVEYRRRLWARLGMAVFAGVGSVAPSLDGFERALPSVGAGLRYVVAKKNDVSIRLDLARGRDETLFYVGLGEAF